MSDKRAAETDNTDPSKKRKILDSLSESGPLTQRDVVYFQKEAIYRQLVEYKSNAQVLQSELAKYTEKYNLYKNGLLLVLTWLDQFIEDVANLSGDAGVSNDDEFLISIDLAHDELEKQLNEKKTKLNSLLTKLASSKSSEFVNDLSDLSKKLNQLKFNKEELTKSNELIQSKYDSLHTKYLTLIKNNERAGSKTLERFTTTVKEEEKPQKEESTPVPSSTSNSNTPTINQDQIDELNAQLKEKTATIEAQNSIIEDQITKLTKLSEKASKDSEPKKEIEGSAEYLLLLKTYESLNLKHNEFLQKYNVLEANFIDMEKKSNLLNDVLNQKFLKEKEKVIGTFSKLENDLTRIRAARDELLSKVAILEAEKSTSAVIKEVQNILKSQQEILDSKPSIELTPDDTFETLKPKHTILLEELHSLEKAFRALQAANFDKFLKAFDYDSQLSKYKIEKQKADQKYFAAMRSKDALVQEIRTLKDFNKASESKISILEETITVTKNEALKNHEERLAADRYSLAKDKEIKTLNDSAKISQDETKKLKEELDRVINSSENYRNTLEENKKVKLKLSKVESQLTSTKEQLDKYKTQGKEAVNQEELNQYRSLIYCSLCSKNWKDTVIKNCGHYFCASCARERLAARMRKCPTCNKQFSSNDLLTVHL